ncbi:MAG: hypothetical protein WDO56_00105 [Gammaproteobacteria bacterium]
MTQYFIARVGQPNEQVDFDMFSAIVEGTAILRTVQRDRGVELELSEGLRLRVIPENGRISAIVETREQEASAPVVRVQLISGKTPPEAALIEKRLGNLRQAYALVFMLVNEQYDTLDAAAKSGTRDFEDFLAEEDRLAIEAAGQGSFWVALRKVGVAAGKAPKAALFTLSALFKDGRRLLLKYVESQTDEKVSQAALADLQVRKGKVELEMTEDQRDRARRSEFMELMERAERLKDESRRERISEALMENVNKANPDFPRLTFDKPK